MTTTAIGGFFGVATRARTWLTFVFHWLAFPLGLFYFVFLVVGLSLGLGLLVVWVGIPILLVVAGAWWLFGPFERLQAQHLLGARVGPAPRGWETVDGVWGKLKAHFGNGATWRDLGYLLAKLPFGVVSFTLAVTLMALVAWLAAFPIAWNWNVHIVSWGSTGGGFTPTWWESVLAVPAAVLLFFASLHVLNGWGWVCARWAELVLGPGARQAPGWAAGPGAPVPPAPPAEPAPIVSTGPMYGAPAAAPAVAPAPAASPGSRRSPRRPLPARRRRPP